MSKLLNCRVHTNTAVDFWVCDCTANAKINDLEFEISALQAKLDMAVEALDFYIVGNEWDYGIRAMRAVNEIKTLESKK